MDVVQKISNTQSTQVSNISNPPPCRSSLPPDPPNFWFAGWIGLDANCDYAILSEHTALAPGAKLTCTESELSAASGTVVIGSIMLAIFYPRSQFILLAKGICG